MLSCFPQQLNMFSSHKRTCSILKQDEGWARSEAGLDIGGISSCRGTDDRKLQKGWGGVTLALLPMASAERERDRLSEGCAVNPSYAGTAGHTAGLPQLPPPRQGAVGTAPKKREPSPLAPAVAPTVLPQQQVRVWLLQQRVACP